MITLRKIAVFRNFWLSLTSENSEKSSDRTDQVENFYEKLFKIGTEAQKYKVPEI